MASAEMNNDQGKRIDKRPNYFAGQYLLEDDFRLEQEYHIDRQRHHNCLLHVSGIATGLKVEPDGELKVKVTAGTAIDFQGKQIILIDNKNLDLEQDAHNKNPIQNGDYILSIKYNEELTARQGNEANAMSRVQEKPVFELSDPAAANVIALAKLTIKGKEVEKIDPSVRQYSGINLPTEDGKGVTLRSSHGNENPNLAVLAGSLSISGALEVKGGSTLTGNVKANGSLTVSNKGKGWMAEFTQQGEGGGVYIHGVKGNNNALNIAGNETIYPTFAVTNKGKGLIAEFTREGEGGGVYIHGVKGEYNALNIANNETINPTFAVTNKGKGLIAQFTREGEGNGVYIGGVKGKHSALNIADNETISPTFAVTNKGSGPALLVEQQGTGLAAQFNGKVVANSDIEVSGNIRIKQNSVTVAEENLFIISGRVDPKGKLKEGRGFKVQQESETGVFLITFINTFDSIPVVVATQYFNKRSLESPSDDNLIGDFSAEGYKTTDNVVVVAANKEKLKIKTGDGNGNGAYREFAFIAIGLRKS